MSEAPDTALIVAGGRGTRLQPLTFATPKPLVEFCGEPFLVGVIRRLAAAGVTRVFLIVGSETAPFSALDPYAAEVGVALEAIPEPEPLDTAGGVRAALDRLDAAFYVLNGDILTDVDFTAVAAAHRGAGADATLVLHRVEDTSAFGVAVREGSRITRFVEKPAPGTLPGQDAINAGTYVLEPHVLAAHPPGRLSFERAVFPDLIARGGHLEGWVWDGVWADLGTPDRFREGHRLALEGHLAWPSVTAVAESSPGVRVHPDAAVAASATLAAPVLILSGAEVGRDAVVGPAAVVGRDATVGAGAVLDAGVLQAGARLGDGVRTEGLLAGPASSIVAGARVGRGAVIGAHEAIVADEAAADGARVPPATG